MLIMHKQLETVYSRSVRMSKNQFRLEAWHINVHINPITLFSEHINIASVRFGACVKVRWWGLVIVNGGWNLQFLFFFFLLLLLLLFFFFFFLFILFYILRKKSYKSCH